MHQGQTVFAQVVELLPRRAFDNAVIRYDGDRRIRNLSCMDQLLAMIFAQITGRGSLRETVLCLDAIGSRRYHCGFRGSIARSTLADANELRDWRIFQDTAMALIHRARGQLPKDVELQRLEADIYALDSTTIDLCLKLFPWAKFRRRKGAVKAHTLLDLCTGIPVFVRVFHAKTHDVWMLDQIVPEPGAYYVMDKGYIDFARLHRLHRAGAFFITRLKRNADYRITGTGPSSPAKGVLSDKFIRMIGLKTRRHYPDTLRKIRYVDLATGKHLTFLSNNLLLDAQTIALLYYKRWDIELLFKWLKQHLHIKSFYGTSPNAVQIQIWVAVIVYVLVLQLRHRHGLRQDPNQILQILSVMTLEKTQILQLFSDLDAPIAEPENHNQLLLFEI